MVPVVLSRTAPWVGCLTQLAICNLFLVITDKNHGQLVIDLETFLLNFTARNEKESRPDDGRHGG